MTNRLPKIIRIGKDPTTAELKNSLRKNEIPLKFCYMGQGAKCWNNLRESKEYKLGDKWVYILEKTLPQVRKRLNGEDYNLIHVGPGNGIEIPSFLGSIGLNGKARYCGIDVSRDMLELAIESNRDTLNQKNSVWYQSDVESKGNLERIAKGIRRKYSERSLILLTDEGTLLSNKSIFKELYRALGKGDYALITIEGDNPEKRGEILQTYSLPQTLKILSVGLRKAGYDYNRGSFSFSFNERRSRVEVYFNTHVGNKLLCLASYKPKKEEFFNELKSFGFDIPYFKFHEEAWAFSVLLEKRDKNVQ
jgi:ubiquinone/menaquinone biosynthesis C-methylase UbiE